MYTSGLVITLSDDPPQLKSAIREIAAAGPFTVGESYGLCLSAVLETIDADDAHQWHEWAAALPGVETVEVVFIDWQPAESEALHACL